MAVWILHQPQQNKWTVDGMVYSTMMLQDAGWTRTAALSMVQHFYESSSRVSQLTEYRELFGARLPTYFQELFPIFAPRLVYPYLSSILYPKFGFMAMTYVSLSAYMLSVVLFYVLMSSWSPSWLAVLGALLYGLLPDIRHMATRSATDMLAVLLWILTLYTIVTYLRRGSDLVLAVYSIALMVLFLTRPMLYLPVGAVLGACVASWIAGNSSARDYRRRATNLALVTVAGCGLYAAVSSATQPLGLVPTIQFHYNYWLTHGNHRHLSLEQWYLKAVTQTGAFQLWFLIRTGAIIGWVSLLFALRRSLVLAPVLLGACIFGMVGIAVNPVYTDLPRVVDAPLWPVLLLSLVVVISPLTFQRKHLTSRTSER